MDEYMPSNIDLFNTCQIWAELAQPSGRCCQSLFEHPHATRAYAPPPHLIAPVHVRHEFKRMGLSNREERTAVGALFPKKNYITFGGRCGFGPILLGFGPILGRFSPVLKRSMLQILESPIIE